VGNLPPGTRITDLKDHFSHNATQDIESVFLISKSNCAFVNYKSDASCTAAMARFHDSRFQGVRLVCRLRRGSAPTSAVTPTGPGATMIPTNESTAPISGEESRQHEDVDGIDGTVGVTIDGPLEKVKEKFFIVKSLTIEDLERSVSSGIWATQAHNEASLNKAYEVSQRVLGYVWG